MTSCVHLKGIRAVVPSAEGCEDCLRLGTPWVATAHPVIRSFEPGEAWGWRYVDERFYDPLPMPVTVR